MSSEKFGEVRERLLREERVQKMIRQRAYEIYQMRGGHPGGEAYDWFKAESEVLAFLIADDSQEVDEKETLNAVLAPPTTNGATTPAKKSTPRRTPAEKKAVSKTASKRSASKQPTANKTTPRRPRKKSKPDNSH